LTRLLLNAGARTGLVCAAWMVAAALVPGWENAQEVANPSQSQSPNTTVQQTKPPPKGTVLFSSRNPPAVPRPAYSSSKASVGANDLSSPDARPAIAVTDAERAAIVISAYVLTVHLMPSSAREEVQARLTLRNASTAPLARVALDLSSTLRWQAVSAQSAIGLTPVQFTQSPVATDADHTGYAQELVATLPHPLAPGQTVMLSVLYAGEIRQSSSRLELIGTPPDRANRSDWDAIVPTSDAGASALRGYGNVLWYPVAAPLALLGDGNKLFAEVARQRRLNTASSIALHLTVEYRGDPPDGAIFDGRLQPLTHVADDQNQLVTAVQGVATADFPARAIGLRLPSLFLTAQTAVSAAGGVLSVVTPRAEAIPPYAEAARTVTPLLAAWFGPTPITPLLLLDHAGEPFADHALLVGQLAADAQPGDIAPLLIDGMTHAWIHSAQPWISEGLAEFMRLLWTERTQGRKAAIAELATLQGTVAFAEPGAGARKEGSAASSGSAASTKWSLIASRSDVAYRLKAAAVWWQLRDLVGEAVLQKSLQAYRKAAAVNPAFDRNPTAMQQTIERTSGHTLDWFFDDWVYNDRGLPDLSIVRVDPRPLPATAAKSGGYLVAVEVRNAGDAAAEVPVTVRSGAALTATERLRIPAHSSAATRVLFGGSPETVELNDGSVPEISGHAVHRKQVSVTVEQGTKH